MANQVYHVMSATTASTASGSIPVKKTKSSNSSNSGNTGHTTKKDLEALHRKECDGLHRQIDRLQQENQELKTQLREVTFKYTQYLEQDANQAKKASSHLQDKLVETSMHSQTAMTQIAQSSLQLVQQTMQHAAQLVPRLDYYHEEAHKKFKKMPNVAMITHQVEQQMLQLAPPGTSASDLDAVSVDSQVKEQIKSAAVVDLRDSFNKKDEKGNQVPMNTQFLIEYKEMGSFVQAAKKELHETSQLLSDIDQQERKNGKLTPKEEETRTMLDEKYTTLRGENLALEARQETLLSKATTFFPNQDVKTIAQALATACPMLPPPAEALLLMPPTSSSSSSSSSQALVVR